MDPPEKKPKCSHLFHDKAVLTYKFLRRSKMVRVILVVVGLNVILAFIVSRLENIPFYLALYWATDTLTNTGSGLVPPKSKAIWVFTTLLMWGGLGITLTFVEFVYRRMLLKMKGKKQITFSNHTLLIGWNPKIRHFLESLPAPLGVDRNYVLICNKDERPFDLPDVVEYIRGRPDEERVLLMAGVAKAEQAIIVMDNDADAILIAMTIQSINVDVRMTVNVHYQENVKHLKRIGIEEIVCDEELTGNALKKAYYKNQEETFI